MPRIFSRGIRFGVASKVNRKSKGDIGATQLRALATNGDKVSIRPKKSNGCYSPVIVNQHKPN